MKTALGTDRSQERNCDCHASGTASETFVSLRAPPRLPLNPFSGFLPSPCALYLPVSEEIKMGLNNLVCAEEQGGHLGLLSPVIRVTMGEKMGWKGCLRGVGALGGGGCPLLGRLLKSVLLHDYCYAWYVMYIKTPYAEA